MRVAHPAPRMKSGYHAARAHTLHGVVMKAFSLLLTVAGLAACAQSPTAPLTQSSARANRLAVPSSTISEARNPSGTGQPSQSCGSATAPTEPNGFGTGGFANAETHYAGSDGTPSQANGNSHAVSQYDVACYQQSNK